MFGRLQMGWIILPMVFGVICCAADPYVRQLKGVHYVRSHQIFRRSNPQRFHSPEKPLSNFEIRRNTIIRTQDSRAMGAEYLSEMQKPSNEACLVWCLEYPRCNVAVFEEKNNRSCYLFDCGTMSDFRCNFTNYTYYVSSILRGTHHPLDLKQWQSQAKHENDLTNLRKMPQPTQSSEYMNQPTVLPSLLPVKSMDEPLNQKRPSQREFIEEQVTKWTPEPACQHYQFQCRSSKECIAIYNVCDGIPQCPDNSDEGPDLHCPAAEDLVKTTFPTTPSPTRPPVPTVPITEQPRLPPAAPQAPMKSPNNLQPLYPQNRPDDIPLVDDNAGPMYGLQDSSKGNLAWNQYQQQALANSQQDDYIAPVKPAKPNHNGYAPQHVLFPNKHSSFHPAGGVNYKSSSYQNSGNPNNNNQWNNDYYNSENYDPPRAPPTEVEYSGAYDAAYRNQGNSNNNFRMGPLKVGGANRPQPFDHYRPINPYWSNDDQIPSKTGYNNKAEGDIPPAPEISHQAIPNHLSRYNEPRPGQQNYRHQTQPLSPPSGYNLQNPQYPSPVDNAQSYMSSYQPLRPSMSESNLKNRRPVVQPQVQNSGQDDDIYDPQAEVPRETVPVLEGEAPQHRQQQQLQQLQLPDTTSTTVQTTSSSTVSPSTSTQKPHVAKPAGPHAQIHSVSHSHVSAASAESGMSVSELQKASRVHAHESNGAVLALTLGLCITAILMVLVGCRLRNLRRRLARRGGRSSLAHDADYLVNGMYL